MSQLSPLHLDDFAPFFRSVHGHDPFPWQQRLVAQVARDGWPSVLDLPTGTGKTAAVDVAVFTLALDAGRRPRSAPLRIIYVVDRRTIVDQAYDRATTISRALTASKDDVVQRVAARLARYTNEDVPLRTALLRGGIARDEIWARTPDQPLIAVSTVDQVGSRLLFRGYGVSDSMKPIHAALLGCDVLYLLDEVHLSQPFRETVTAIRDRYRTWAEQPGSGAFVVVEMSATPGAAPHTAFQLDDRDRAHAVLSTRLKAPKPASLVSTTAKGLSHEIEKHVLSMLDRRGATIAVVVNRVASAREVHERLREIVPDGSTSIHLLTGRMRPFDRDALEQSVLERVRAGRIRRADDQPIVVVATQSIEAGADFDFDGLVTECASLDALRQRFGRLDRLGALAGSARGAIVVRTDALKDDPVYGDAIGNTWNWLKAVAVDKVVDFGIEALRVPHDAEARGLLSPKTHAPVLLPSHLDAWVQTAPIPNPDPDVALWLHGPQRGVADVQIVWRADLTEELLTQAIVGPDGTVAIDIALNMVDVLPPVSAEAMSVPFLAAKRWLQGRPEPASFDVEGAEDTDDSERELPATSVPRAAVLWQGDQSTVIDAANLRPGQTIVVPSSYGGIANGNWAPASRMAVADVAELASWRYGRRPVLRLHEAVVHGLFGADVDVPKATHPDSESQNDQQLVANWIATVDSARLDAKTRDLFDAFRHSLKWIQITRLPTMSGENADEYLVIAVKRRPTPTADAADDRVSTESAMSSFTGIEVTLVDHLQGVAEIATGFAQRLGLPEKAVDDLRLAAQWHDVGKADPRFQRWLLGGSEFKAMVQAKPLAKSAVRLSSRLAIRAARERAGYPAGGRHEVMSLALVESVGESLAHQASDWTLVQHVIASHHGYCRPLAPCVTDLHAVRVTFRRNGITCDRSSAHELARLDSGVAERFWLMVRKYGWWGLAWFESILRLADHRQSEREQIEESKRNA